MLNNFNLDGIVHGLQQKARKQAGCFIVLASSMADIEEATPGNDKTRRLIPVNEGMCGQPLKQRHPADQQLSKRLQQAPLYSRGKLKAGRYFRQLNAAARQRDPLHFALGPFPTGRSSNPSR